MNYSYDRLSTQDVADLLGVKRTTVAQYLSQGRMPAPDGYLGRTPWWRRSTVEEWDEGRPGSGGGNQR